jgi:DNA-binding transcriptional MerR regulator
MAMETDLGAHLSIGEVLSLLKEEFPDVTISKIRFLESQGLIDPERTPSGYRKFYEPDIDRLRWVLRLQRDHFLPLKVIKARLDSGQLDVDEPEVAQPELFADETAAPTEHPEPVVEPPREEEQPHDPAAWLAALQESPRPARPAPATRPVEPLLDPDDDLNDQRYDAAELAAAAGVDVELVEQLAGFGLVLGSRFGGEVSYDDRALEVVRAAAAFVDRGIEPRHLRAYKLAAEREAGLFEQLALPLLRQRNPEARRQAAELVSELGQSGEVLRRALLRQAMRAHVPPR